MIEHESLSIMNNHCSIYFSPWKNYSFYLDLDERMTEKNNFSFFRTVCENHADIGVWNTMEGGANSFTQLLNWNIGPWARPAKPVAPACHFRLPILLSVPQGSTITSIKCYGRNMNFLIRQAWWLMHFTRSYWLSWLMQGDPGLGIHLEMLAYVDEQETITSSVNSNILFCIAWK